MSSAFKYLTLKIVNVDFMSNLFASMKFVGATGLGGFWVLEWAWHIRVINLRCGQGYVI